MTPTEINEAVARKMGWHTFTEDHKKAFRKDSSFDYGVATFVPNYCTSIAEAWEVVESQKGKLISIQNPGFEWICRIIDAHNSDEVSDGASTAPMAICLAFLKLP